MRHFAVLGSPIEHSLSPVLHETAYRILGFDADYVRAEVRSGELAAFVDGLDADWGGLSLTMPLKREVMPLLDEVSPLAERLGVANTLVFETSETGVRRLAGHNTDVDGIVRAIRSLHDVSPSHATILGGGATAASALAAAAALGATSATLHLRDTSRGGDVAALAGVLGVALTVEPLAAVGDSGIHDFVISTLPGGVAVPDLIPEKPTSVLLDVAYDPWPSPLARAWEARGGSAVSGLDMLVEQAIGQIRLFTGRAQDRELPDEPAIRRALRDSVGLPVD
ncbi:shikimate dehydrogenase [Frondihabitans australicus]|uniref:Shikimate dehydrogenase n=1 Tax=Frondihabitans australicus TaxID=386892 RepID=A0A495IMJ7_9MICO|nr:shikimate dehydrogenase [Frondihabitans australicus]RKR76668.1 shikimate dehydrogenase [Frondihabitans australicus]